MDKVLISFTLSIIIFCVWLICLEEVQEVVEFGEAVGDCLFGYLRCIDFLLVVLHGEVEIRVILISHMRRQWP